MVILSSDLEIMIQMNNEPYLTEGGISTSYSDTVLQLQIYTFFKSLIY